MCLQSIAPPLQQAQHSPCRTSIINQSESRALAPASLSANQISEHSVKFSSHYIMLSQRLNNIPSNRCSQTAHFPVADWNFCLHLIKKYINILRQHFIVNFLSVCLYLSVCLSVCQSMYPSIYLPVYLSIYT